MIDGFDLVLGGGLCAAAVAALASRDLFRAIVMFIVFGLLMALAWVRLSAPDIALAEAAIGAGLTGVLLLDTLGYLRRRFGDAPAQDGERGGEGTDHGGHRDDRAETGGRT
ncbi:MAG: Na(+)/H(+) antiporter subunit B [Rhodocyclaceae bacterium]